MNSLVAISYQIPRYLVTLRLTASMSGQGSLARIGKAKRLIKARNRMTFIFRGSVGTISQFDSVVVRLKNALRRKKKKKKTRKERSKRNEIRKFLMRYA